MYSLASTSARWAFVKTEGSELAGLHTLASVEAAMGPQGAWEDIKHQWGNDDSKPFSNLYGKSLIKLGNNVLPCFSLNIVGICKTRRTNSAQQISLQLRCKY